MNIRYQISNITHRILALFLTFTILMPSVTPYNSLFAQSTGPNAPEAAAFEPVDATDMVNLTTGSFTYVLPLLNIPSPEGGYPLALNYHAGIAMDQAASWVGLGWNLNPGSINRGVNGYPDDWGKTNINEFFYDKGGEENYYNFGAGITLEGGVSVGIGASWGSNQSLGGYVNASIGIDGRNSPSLGVELGTNGLGLKGNLANGISFSLSGGDSGPSLGIGFSSTGNSINRNGIGAGVSNSTNGASVGDYDVEQTTSGFYFSAAIFYIDFTHRKVKYSLHKYNNLSTSGILYPVEANEVKTDSDNNSRLLSENHFMDVNTITRFDKTMDGNELINGDDLITDNKLVLPNYDNYAVNAQGLSGTMSPYIHSTLNLSARGRGEQNEDDIYYTYLNYAENDYVTGTGANLDAKNKMNFTFNSAYNSFLRLDRNNIAEHIPSSAGSPIYTDLHSDHIMDRFRGTETSVYDNSDSTDGSYLKRKREGSFIETYTNRQIKDSYISETSNLGGFIDAVDYDSNNNKIIIDRSDAEMFPDKGIGAYKITALDGKTYHYSLPVYNFETFYKNFEEEDKVYDKFFEIRKTEPYATHWLLTAITGPDYYDKNDNGKLDETDYGYWVNFEYGKWSDGFGWRTPIEGYHEEKSVDGEDVTYSYSWGRKQIYYLDAIKTRTHTALFVKDLREDNHSSEIKEDHVFEAQEGLHSGMPVKNVYYTSAGESYTFPTSNLYCWNYKNYLRGYKESEINFNISESYSLKLSKIIVLNNNFNANKDRNTIVKNISGSIYSNYKYRRVFVAYCDISELGLGDLYVKNPLITTNFNSQLSQNVLDVNDIQGLGLEEQAVEVIDLEYDYSLVEGTPNSSSGRLTLKEVKFKGKEGVQLVPPYQFSYRNTIPYNKEYEDDWGYYDFDVTQWSLNEIKTPTGGKIKIDYEEDLYTYDAASYENEFFENINLSKEGNYIQVQFNDSFDLTNSFYVSKNVELSFSKYTVVDQFGTTDVEHDQISFLKVMSIDNEAKQLYLSFVEGTTYTYLNPSDLSNSSSNKLEYHANNWNYRFENFKIKNNYDFRTVAPEINTKGGGIRTINIAINDGIKDIATTEYEYKEGITSYVPGDRAKGIPYVSELPAPTVMYGEVEMKNYDGDNNFLGKTVYNFETLEVSKNEPGYIYSLGESFRVREDQSTTFHEGEVVANKFTIESKLGNLGRINAIATFNQENQLLNKKINHYKSDLDEDQEIGVTQETHSSYKIVKEDDEEKYYVSSTSKVNYPSVLESVTETTRGFSLTKTFDKYDFLTGQVLETSTYASDGVAFKTKTVPAYEKYPAMGSKVDDVNNKNMLSQSAGSYSYLLDENGNEQLIGVGITTWNNDWTYQFNDNTTETTNEVWRKHKSYVWNGASEDGIYTDFTDNFDWGIHATQTSDWKKISETIRYNHFSNPLEVKDINNNYAATKMGDNYSKVIATSNAAYDDMYYSGAEYIDAGDTSYFDGGIKSVGYMGVTNRVGTSEAHTGNFVVEINSGEKAFEVQVPRRDLRNTLLKERFKVSVWVEKGKESVVKIALNDTQVAFKDSEKVYAGYWVLVTGYITIPTAGANVGITSTSGAVRLDDFRLHPIASSMTSYVYNEWDELSYTMGTNGLSTHYIYDAAGRLIETQAEIAYKEPNDGSGGFKRVSTNSYNYKNN